MKKTVLFLVFILAIGCSMNGQPNNKLARIITLVEHSDFTTSYKTFQQEVEEEIFLFKQHQNRFAPEDVATIKRAYDETKIKLDRIIDHLKEGFTSRGYRKSIKSNPESTLQAMLASDFNAASNYYKEHCRRRIDALINADSGAFNPLVIITVIGITGETFNMINKMRENKKEEFEQYFEIHYAKGKRLKTWEEI